MKIGALARATGLSVQTLRFYEAEGLLTASARTESGYRVFGKAELERIEFVKKAKRLGLSLSEIKDILSISVQQQPTCVHVRSLLEQKVDDVERTLRELGEFRERLLQLLQEAGTLEDCRPAGGRICGIIEQSSVSAEPALLQKLQARDRGPRQDRRQAERNNA